MTNPANSSLAHRGAKLTPEQWAEVILLWRQGASTLRGLSEKFGVGTSTLTEKFNRVGAKKGDLLAKQAAAAEAAAQLDGAELAKRIFETKNDTYRLLKLLRSQVAAEVVKAKQTNTPLAAIKHDMQALKAAAEAVAVCRREAYIVLGIKEGEEGDGELPDLVIRGLEPDEIDLLSQRAVDDGNLAVEIAEGEDDRERAARMSRGEDVDEDDDAQDV